MAVDTEGKAHTSRHEIRKPITRAIYIKIKPMATTKKPHQLRLPYVCRRMFKASHPEDALAETAVRRTTRNFVRAAAPQLHFRCLLPRIMRVRMLTPPALSRGRLLPGYS